MTGRTNAVVGSGRDLPAGLLLPEGDALMNFTLSDFDGYIECPWIGPQPEIVVTKTEATYLAGIENFREDTCVLFQAQSKSIVVELVAHYGTRMGYPYTFAYVMEFTINGTPYKCTFGASSKANEPSYVRLEKTYTMR